MKNLWILTLLAVLPLRLLAADPSTPDKITAPQYSKKEQQEILDHYRNFDPKKLIPEMLREKALLAYHFNLRKLANTRFLTVVDFQLDSDQKRFFIVDMINGRVWGTFLAHARKTDKNGRAVYFSNTPGSGKNSLGIFTTTSIQSGPHGQAIYLEGQSSSNSNAKERGLAIFGADYVKNNPVKQGLSAGSFAVPKKFHTQVIRILQGGSLVYAGKSTEISEHLAQDTSDNAPFTETAEAIGPSRHETVANLAPRETNDLVTLLREEAPVKATKEPSYRLPDFDASWGLARSVYNKAASYMAEHAEEFPNKRYVVLVDMSKHSNQKRVFLFDLETGVIEKHVGAHGSGSDPGRTGYAKYFSNTNNSLQTSLGAYKTLGTFYWNKHGTSLRLQGLEGTNDNALARGILVHSASYMNDAGYSGTSWGCVAIDPRISDRFIGLIKNGALLVIWK